MVPWYQRCGTWYNIVQMWWNLVPKVGVPVPSLCESVPTKISCIDVSLDFLEQILAFNTVDIDTDVTVTWSVVVWSCPLVSRGLA